MPQVVAQAIAKIDVDESGVKQGFEGIKGHLKEGEGLFSHLGGTIAGVFGAAAILGGVGLLVHSLGDMVKSGEDANLTIAQTDAVLKSTHSAAGMTASAVGDLATKYMNLTGIDDDVVQSAENMLLTFTNIGQNVFPQATKTVLDMSVALGQDTKNSAIQLGKALNDPIKGVSALQRVGVTFDVQQKELIKTYMAHGDIAKAQGVILTELSKEFGGSAEAAGHANGGVKILTAQWENMKQTIGQAVIPILGQLMGALLPIVQGFAALLPDALAKAQAVIGPIVGIVGNLVGHLGDLFSTMQPVTMTIKDTAVHSNHLGERMGFLGEAVAHTQTFMERVRGPLAFLLDLFGQLQPLLKGIADFFTPVTQHMQEFTTVTDQAGDVVKNGHGHLSKFSVALGAVKDVTVLIQPHMSKFQEIAGKIGDLLKGYIIPTFQALAKFIGGDVIPVVIKLAGWFETHVVPILHTLYGVFVNNILPALQRVWVALSENLIPALQHLWEKLSPVLLPVLQLLGWVLQNVVGPAIGLGITLIGNMIDMIANLIGKIGDFLGVLGHVKDAIGNAFGGLSNLHIPGFATGVDDAPGGLAMVGEHGPELVYLPQHSRVVPAGETASMLSGGSVAGHPGRSGSTTASGGYGTPIILKIDGRTIATAILPYVPNIVRNATGSKGA